MSRLVTLTGFCAHNRQGYVPMLVSCLGNVRSKNIESPDPPPLYSNYWHWDM